MRDCIPPRPIAVVALFAGAALLSCKKDEKPAEVEPAAVAASPPPAPSTSPLARARLGSGAVVDVCELLTADDVRAQTGFTGDGGVRAADGGAHDGEGTAANRCDWKFGPERAVSLSLTPVNPVALEASRSMLEKIYGSKAENVSGLGDDKAIYIDGSAAQRPSGALIVTHGATDLMVIISSSKAEAPKLRASALALAKKVLPQI